jgi:hypothetical protein
MGGGLNARELEELGDRTRAERAAEVARKTGLEP